MKFTSWLRKLNSAYAPSSRTQTGAGRRPSVRPSLEVLEDRCTPAGTVTGSLAPAAAGGKVWTLTGDAAANNINVSVASTGTPGAFKVTDGGGTTVAGVTNPSGVQVIVFNMLGDNDIVNVNVAKLRNMIFQGGDGANTFSAQRFRLTNRLQVVNGIGNDFVTLSNSKIGGNVNINNGSGGSFTYMQTLSAAAGFNNIAGDVNITNSTGVDFTVMRDTNVGGNITVNNGAGAGAGAGFFQLYNFKQAGSRAVVGGNVTVTFQDGDASVNGVNGIWDALVRGNVLFNNGSGSADTRFDGLKTTLPVVIQGRLKIVGTGANLVSIGQTDKKTGLRVGQNLVIDVQDPAELTLKASKLFVYGEIKFI